MTLNRRKFIKAGALWVPTLFHIRKASAQILQGPIMRPTTAAGSSALLTNLISYWKMDEASGDRADSHGSETLTDHNTVGSATGIIGNAADLEFTNGEYFSHADDAALSLGADTDLTLSCWVQLESKDSFDNDIITKDAAGIGTAATAEYALFMDNAGSDRFQFTVGNGTTFGEVEANVFGSPPLATWIFIVAWHDSAADTVNIQVNNGTANTAAWAGGTLNDGAGEFNIGAVLGGFRCFDGLIDEVGFWKRTLTSGERTSLYGGGSGLTYPF